MKKLLILTLVLFMMTIGQAIAQVGINLSYTTTNAPNLQRLMQESRFYPNNAAELKSSFKYGLDYWFRLPKTRIEFLPTLSYSKFQSKTWIIGGDPFPTWGQIVLKMANLDLHTNIYPFNILGDCDCPTFSNQDPFLKKGFFIQISPGLTYTLFHKYSLLSVNDNEPYEFFPNKPDFSPSLGLGFGLDIGFSDLITLTPFVRAIRNFNVHWINTEPTTIGNRIIDSRRETTHITQFEAGIRFGLRWKT